MAKKRNSASNSLKKKSRLEILDLLVRTMEENEKLREENEALKKRLEDQQMVFDESGTLADACLKLSGIFEAADRAIALYRENQPESPVKEGGEDGT